MVLRSELIIDTPIPATIFFLYVYSNFRIFFSSVHPIMLLENMLLDLWIILAQIMRTSVTAILTQDNLRKLTTINHRLNKHQ